MDTPGYGEGSDPLEPDPHDLIEAVQAAADRGSETTRPEPFVDDLIDSIIRGALRPLSRGEVIAHADRLLSAAWAECPLAFVVERLDGLELEDALLRRDS